MEQVFKLTRIRDGKEFPIDDFTILIGRSEFCHIQLENDDTSREHARLTQKQEGMYVEDLHSTNGTQVNNKQITKTTLINPGDIIKFSKEAYSLQLKENHSTVVISAADLRVDESSSTVSEDEDEEDQNCTIVHHAYVLPPGWNKSELSDSSQRPMDKRKADAIDKFVANASKGMKGRHGLILFFTIGENPPLIKSVSTADDTFKWSIGRSKQCDITIENPGISDIHAYLEFNKNQWTISDNGSTNGILAGKQKVTSAVLQNGHQLILGPAELLIRLPVNE